MLNPVLPIPDHCRFHHIGYATKSIQYELPFFMSQGYVQDGEIFCDAKQGISGCFMTGAGPRIELLENLPASDTLTPWINLGIKMYHFAYMADNLEDIVRWAKTNKAHMIVDPIPAVAFSGKAICFLMLRNRFMLEFIEQ